MRKILSLLIMLFLSIALTACHSSETIPETTKIKTIELLSDSDFSGGFEISPADADPQPDNRYPLSYNLEYSSSDESISWLLSQHGCRYGLADKYAIDGETVQYIDGNYYIEDVAKKLVINPADKEITFTMNTSLEYLTARKDKEGWPHLLVEQGFTSQEELVNLEGLVLNLDITLEKSKLMMTDEEYNASLHTAQFIMYIIVRTNSALDGGSFMWFGIPLYDARYNFIQEAGMIDAGTSGNTGMFIYHLPSIDSLPNGLNIGVYNNVNMDLLPYMQRALSLAHSQGVLLNTEVENLYLTGMNIGWEVPGTYDISIKIANLSIIANRK